MIISISQWGVPGSILFISYQPMLTHSWWTVSKQCSGCLHDKHVFRSKKEWDFCTQIQQNIAILYAVFYKNSIIIFLSSIVDYLVFTESVINTLLVTAASEIKHIKISIRYMILIQFTDIIYNSVAIFVKRPRLCVFKCNKSQEYQNFQRVNTICKILLQ